MPYYTMNNLMKYVLLFIFVCLGFWGSLNAQLGLELRSGYNDELCPGYDDEENTVILDVVNMPPLTPAPNTRVEYYWLITHENGDWVYQTDNPARAFKMVFPGSYTMRCQVLYVNLLTANAYASFWSSPLIVETGHTCD